jgi:hypothetical protein
METVIAKPEKKIDRYIVMTASARMPANCRGRYGKVAVVETDQTGTPKMISTHARHCVEVVQIWDRRNIGTTRKCAYCRAIEEARKLAAELNKQSEK